MSDLAWDFAHHWIFCAQEFVCGAFLLSQCIEGRSWFREHPVRIATKYTRTNTVYPHAVESCVKNIHFSRVWTRAAFATGERFTTTPKGYSRRKEGYLWWQHCLNRLPQYFAEWFVSRPKLTAKHFGRCIAKRASSFLWWSPRRIGCYFLLLLLFAQSLEAIDGPKA